MLKASDKFVIVHRAKDAGPDSIYPPDGRLAACISVSINYSQGYFQLPRVQAAFLSYAIEYARTNPNVWYKDPANGFKDIEHVVSDFFSIVSAEFFLISIDFSITNPDCVAGTAHREWHGRFSPRDHCISLNGPRVGDMVAAATRASSSKDRNDYDNKELRTFLFIFATAFFHETCHLFTNYLTQGRAATPPHIRSPVEGYSKVDQGEFGRFMEIIVFEGTLEYYRDPSRGVGQSGIPYIITPDGARKISQTTINAVVDYKKIGTEYPIILSNRFIDTRTLETLGLHHPPTVWTDPFRWKIMHQFKNHKHKPFTDASSEFWGLPLY